MRFTTPLPDVLCRLSSKSHIVDIEDVIWYFLLTSFDSKEGVWIVSPWISAFDLSRKVLYLPYVSSSNVVEVLEKLSKVTTVRVLTRCFDDFLPFEVLYILYKYYDEKRDLPKDIASYFYTMVNESAKRLNSMIKIASTGVQLKTDIEHGVWITGRIPPRLHAKLYINDELALIGSANFTHMGVSRDGNLECISIYTRDHPYYSKLRDYAVKLFDQGRPFDDCVKSVIGEINRVLGPLHVSLRDLDDISHFLVEVQEYLKRFIL